MAKTGSTKRRPKKAASKKTTPQTIAVRDLVVSLAFFSDLADPEIDVILPLCHEMKGKAGDTLIQEGQPVKNLYILLSGEAAVFKKQADGKPALLAAVGKGDVLGELSFLQSVSASATVKAKKPFTALAIDQSDLQRLLVTDLNIAAKLYQKLAFIASRRMSATLRHHFDGQSSL